MKTLGVKEQQRPKMETHRGFIVSRALVKGLSAQQSDTEFNALLDKSIHSIFEASNT
jgi:fructose-bisphosphate aldolase, class I